MAIKINDGPSESELAAVDKESDNPLVFITKDRILLIRIIRVILKGSYIWYFRGFVSNGTAMRVRVRYNVRRCMGTITND